MFCFLSCLCYLRACSVCFVRMHRARTIRIARVCIRSTRKLRVSMHRMPLLGRRPSQRTRRLIYPPRNQEGIMACPSSDFHPSGHYSRVLGSLVGSVNVISRGDTISPDDVLGRHSSALSVIPYFNIPFMLILSQR